MEENNVLNEYNPAEVLVAETEESKLTHKKQSIHEILVEYIDIIYTDIKELTKTNIIQYTIHLLNSTLIT